MDDSDMTVHEAFERLRQTTPNHPFIHAPTDAGSKDFTYGEAGSAVDDLVQWYRDAGYGPGHHIALLLESRPEFYLHWLALNAIGATLVPVGSDLVPEEVRQVLELGEVDLLVCLESRLQSAAAAASGLPGLRVESLGSIRAPPVTAPGPRAAGSGAAIVFTSGSTGRPKGCILSNEYFLTFGRWYRDMGGRCQLRPQQERFITPLPPNHVNALAFSSMGAIMTGGCIVQLERFRPNTWWSTVRNSRATVMHYLGVMPGMLLKLPHDPEERNHDLRFGIGGGVRGDDHQPFEERFGVPLLEAWAMTETGGAGTISTHESARHVGTGCIGRPSPKYSEARIVDERGNPLPLNAVGELVVRATGGNPHRGFFSGYYKDAEATQNAWRGGWLHSGDLARQDDEGTFFFVGRRKQIIRRSGENISAAEVESVLTLTEHVLQAAVVPVPDAIREEEVFACVVTDSQLPPTRESAAALLKQAAERISYFKLPGYVAFVSTLPTTATQKLRYGAISELARALLADPADNVFDVRDVKRLHRKT